MIDLYRRLLELIGRLEQAVVVFLLANIVVNIMAQVISRYFFGRPLVWVEEVATYSFIWATFLGASLALKYDRHVKIDTFVGRLPERLGALARVAVFLVIIGFLATLLPHLERAIEVEMRRRTIALPVQIPSGWFFSVPLATAAVLMLLTAVFKVLVELRFALGGPRPPPIMPPLITDHDDDSAAERALTGEPEPGADRR